MEAHLASLSLLVYQPGKKIGMRGEIEAILSFSPLLLPNPPAGGDGSSGGMEAGRWRPGARWWDERPAPAPAGRGVAEWSPAGGGPARGGGMGGRPGKGR
uniref:Uncharacterized protein n=1 Tax=Oryza sativa subsp. japonica TaxID=39947 RepID=Q6K4U5_ORYSJ|nr:hypothetical protein [Oryza sativa Japonica Group]